MIEDSYDLVFSAAPEGPAGRDPLSADRARPRIRLSPAPDEVASTGVTAPLVPEPPPPAPTASVPDADRPRTPRPLPWTGRGERADKVLLGPSSR